MLRVLTTVRCHTIARQGFRRQLAVAWYLARKDVVRAISIRFSR